MSPLIIGLGNKARHGKDSFAASVESHYANQHYAAMKHSLTHYKPVIVQKLAFADALYREVNAWLGTDLGRNWIIGKSMAHTGYDTRQMLPSWVTPDPSPEKSVRAPLGKHAKLLQWWGTEYRRNQDRMYWVKKWGEGINPKADIVLATDMRFENEAIAVKLTGGFTVNVSRLNQDGTPFVDPSRDANHPSETELDGYNYDFRIVVKTGDQSLLDEYAMTLVHYLRALKGHK